MLSLAALAVGCRFDPGVPAAPGGIAATPEPADNSRCLVCHANYEEENLARTHARAGTGCTACHGESFDHAGDEGNVTPPDVIFPLEEVSTACRRCHGTRRGIPAPVARCGPLERCCTDCHGEHRLARRTVRWDPRTREVLPD